MRRIKHVRQQKSDRPQKFIRVNSHTVIQADFDTPDDVVRERFAQRELKNINSLHNPPKNNNFFR